MAIYPWVLEGVSIAMDIQEVNGRVSPISYHPLRHKSYSLVASAVRSAAAELSRVLLGLIVMSDMLVACG